MCPLLSLEGTGMPEALYALALLACPLGMGAMMWFMMRGQKEKPVYRATDAERDEFAQLRAEIDRLEAERDTGRTIVSGPAR